MLEKAVAQVRQLPEEQQDAIAALILEEIEDEARWDTSFAHSHHLPARLAAEAESVRSLAVFSGLSGSLERR